MTLPTPSDRATGCATDGKSDLNLTRTMADVWAAETTAPEPVPMPTPVPEPSQQHDAKLKYKRKPLPRRRTLQVDMRRGNRIPFAGYDPSERQLGITGGSWA